MIELISPHRVGPLAAEKAFFHLALAISSCLQAADVVDFVSKEAFVAVASLVYSLRSDLIPPNQENSGGPALSDSFTTDFQTESVFHVIRLGILHVNKHIERFFVDT